ncbi:MAG TPA: phosphatase PAP2 family protein [Patescibacteria group bacterium]|jgi:membrane-associated phospholipid phosphatase|nr:phosphatase PAP2 family protein [Patescibacteria group bacterium]
MINHRLILTVLCIGSFLYGEQEPEKVFLKKYSKHSYIERRKNYATNEKHQSKRHVSTFVTRFARDVFLLHKNLCTWDTLKVAAAIVPTTLIAHHFDDKIQASFYDKHHHKNTNQLPHWTREFARHITGPTIGLLALQGFLSKNDDFRLTSHIMLIGVPILVFMNQFIKKMNFEICYRPWHEQFSCVKRSLGGFPSGHLSHAVYLAVLYGVRHGYKFALPLGCMSTFIAATFLSCNRHYLSQLIAGVGFGAVYGLAASKVVDYKLTHDIDIEIQAHYDNDGPSVTVAWRF